jgi:hypothetical protein
MPNPEAIAVVHAAVSLSRSHAHAPAIDLLDLVMKGRIDETLDFADPTAVNGSLAAPVAPFGQLLAAACDEAMTPIEWAAFTAPAAEASLRNGCLEIWRVHVLPRSLHDMGWSSAACLEVLDTPLALFMLAASVNCRTVGGLPVFQIAAAQLRRSVARGLRRVRCNAGLDDLA